MGNVIQRLSRVGIIPVVTIDDPQSAVPLGQALLNGGLPCAEITFRTAGAAEAIRQISAGNPDLLVGAGTVLSVAQAEMAVGSGAEFIVSPGFDARVVDWCLANGIVIIPGVMTPTDINLAMASELTVLKFFPAEAAGGVKTLKAISAPYAGIKFIPTGGITRENLAEYLRLTSVLACGGSFMVKKQLIADGDFDMISKLARTAVDIVESVRRNP